MVIDKYYIIHKITLFDTGADQNCIIEGLIPTRYLDMGTTRLFSATGEKLKINYKLHKAHICNNGIGFINDFVITKDINEEIILGIPFITQIKPYAAQLDGIHTKVLGKSLIFPYLNSISNDENEFIKDRSVFKINSLSNHKKYY